jgi:hypothetical protein
MSLQGQGQSRGRETFDRRAMHPRYRHEATVIREKE